MSMEKASFLFPPGVRFHPSDEELIVYYLINKLNSRPLPAAVVGEIELYNHNPWDLPKKALFGEDEWYFFSPRERKYPNGARPNRSAASGYWKATGTDKVITSTAGARIGVKKALVFYVGKPPNGIKSDWIMTEYRIPDTLIRPQKSKGSMRLDHWVLCRIKQKGNMSKNMWENNDTPPNQNTRPTGDIPNMNDFPPVSSNPLSQVCSNYFQPNDCPLLAKLGANNQDMPSSARTISQRSSNIGRLYTATTTTTTYEHIDSSMDSASRMTDSSYNNFEGSYNNQMSTPSYNDNGYQDFTQFNRGDPVLIRNESDVAVGLPPPSNNTTSFYDHQSRDNFNLNLLGAMANLHPDMFDNHFRQPVNTLTASEL